jgi:membrane protease YdiL (CAAX protease family)
VLAVVVGGILAVPTLSMEPTVGAVVVVVVVAELGFGLTGVAFALSTGRGLGWLDLDLAVDRRTLLRYVLGGAVVLFAFRSAVLAVAAALGVPFTPPRLSTSGFDTRAFALALIPLSLFVIAPCEELLFRGVLQQYLGEAVSPRMAVFAAGVLFGLIHVPNYTAYSALGAAVSLFVVFVVGLGFGYCYERTGSLWVPIGVHGLYNAFIMASALALAELGYVSL